MSRATHSSIFAGNNLIDRGAWWATVHGVTRVRHNRTTEHTYSVLFYMSGECMLLGSLSRHNKDLERRTLKSPWRVTALGSWTNHVIALRQISVTVLFYLEDSWRIHPRRREESGGAC